MAQEGRAKKHFDEYGFLKVKGSTDTEENDFRSHNYGSDAKSCSDAELVRWAKLLGTWKEAKHIRPQEITVAITDGVPFELRGTVWSLLLQVNETAAAHGDFNYKKEKEQVLQLIVKRLKKQKKKGQLPKDSPPLSADKLDFQFLASVFRETSDEDTPSNAAVHQICLDLDRTFYTHEKFMDKQGEGQRSLFNILALYAKYNPTVGYCQGMAYIAAVLLMNLTEEEAFWGLISLLESPRYMQGLYSESLQEVQRMAGVFSALLNHTNPKIGRHLQSLGVHPLMYVTPWFMCAFTSLPLWNTVLGIWDFILLHGVNSMYAVGIAIMECCEKDILATTSLGELLPYLQHLPAAKVKRSDMSKRMYSRIGEDLDRDLAHVETVISGGASPSTLLPPVVVESKPMRRPSRRVRRQATETPGSTLRRFLSKLATPLRNITQTNITAIRQEDRENRPPLDIVRPCTFIEGNQTQHSHSSPLRLRPQTRSQTRLQQMQAPNTPLTPKQSQRLHGPLEPLSPKIVAAYGISPSFNRSGILSPSFRSPMLGSLPGTPLSAGGSCGRPGPPRQLLPVPEENAFLETDSPGELQSFRMFSMQTPLRPSQTTLTPSTHASASQRSSHTKKRVRESVGTPGLRKSGGENCFSPFMLVCANGECEEEGVEMKKMPSRRRAASRKRPRMASLAELN